MTHWQNTKASANSIQQKKLVDALVQIGRNLFHIFDGACQSVKGLRGTHLTREELMPRSTRE
jgi:hypothetical protein